MIVSDRSSQVEGKLPECQCLVKNSVVAMGSRVDVVVLVGVVLLVRVVVAMGTRDVVVVFLVRVRSF